MPTISNQAGTVILLADLRLGYDGVSVAARSQVHSSLDGSSQLIILRDDTPRTGTLELFFKLDTDAWAAFGALRKADVWQLSDDVEAVEMTFVRAGAMSPVQQDNRDRWVLRLGFREVLP